MNALQNSLAGILLLLLASPLAAQQRPDPAFEQLEPGQLMRIETGKGAPIEGRFWRIRPDLLAVELDEVPAVLIADIDEFRVRGNGAVKGIVIGGLAGAAAGGLLGGAACGFSDDPGCNAGTLAILGSLLGGVSIGGLGGLIGLATPRWHLRYERIPTR